MDINFEIGNPNRPKGHALAYFKVDTEPDYLYATYVVTLPIQADLTKYVPPFLASHLGNLPLNDFSSFAMPPVPERINAYSELENLSRLRDDDLIYAGNVFSLDLPRMMEMVTEMVQEYAKLCADQLLNDNAQPQDSIESAPEDVSYQVNDVLFSLMSESDKLAELARLLGKLRFAQEGNDSDTISEIKDEVGALSRHLPEEFRVTSLLSAAQDSSPRGLELAQLYLDRCFRLSEGDTSTARELEAKINALDIVDT
tara:strand:+ start:88 stop:855 length:768 start_codon:yes stop_codon:yes gene_type:complete